ncbi:MAG: UTP--glucose-1-phosphate uridylyltransferase [Leptospiraceae bacterium]|nr:UTP--glucose-1-phosphate uridylyltransferase [Leptospiraceae bacterium]MCP5494862.1 UTP--glucose-1-phosphate uridylyltransferase [Leptospiraceae bacterium]
MDNTDQAITEKMKTEGMSDALVQDFLAKVEKVKQGSTGLVNWNEIGDLIHEEDEVILGNLQKTYTPQKGSLSKLAVIKLNGGMGTSMGLSKAKSLIRVKKGLSFLHIIAKQIEYMRNKYSIEIPLILMDSFNTQKDCQNELNQMHFSQSLPTTFLQNKVPRLLKDTLLPVTLEDKNAEWCPPGHGDIYLSLKERGLLQNLLDKGYEYAFLSNGDNLGATIEPHILEYMIDKKIDFAMEMTAKTLADKKGGVMYRKIVNKQLTGINLLETAQVPPEYMDEFTGDTRFPSFSINNLWISLKTLSALMAEKPLDLSLIVNPKVIEGKEVIQLETAMGSAISNFKNVKCVIIPRDRFAPVKKCEDLLVRMSDSYVLNEDYSLTMNPIRKKAGLGECVVNLDDAYYKKVGDFESLFKEYPSMVFCESLTIVGQVEFDVYVNLIGKVSIQNQTGQLQKISSLNKLQIENEEIAF